MEITTPLHVLPDELIVQILLRVPVSSFRAINATCKYWHTILARREFWKYLAKLIWNEKSIPTSDVVTSSIDKVPVIPGDQLIDWKEYFKIRSKLDGIASIMNALHIDFAPINLDADLETKIEMVSNNLRDNMIPGLDDEESIEQLLSMTVSCCDLNFSFGSLGIVWLEKLPAQYFTALAANKDLLQKILKITQEVLKHGAEDNKMLVIEFWSSSCDQEVDYREEHQEPSADNSSLFIGWCCKDLVPLLIGAIADDKYAATEHEDWNVRRSAETCLQLVVNVVLEDIVPLVEPILRQDLDSEDWKRRDVALVLLGLMFSEQHYDYVEQNAASYLLKAIQSLQFNNVNVRSSAAWTINQIYRTYAEHVQVHNKLLSKAILGALRDDTSVRQHIYSCIVNFHSEELENPFEDDFGQLIAVLISSLSAPGNNGDSLQVYEAISSLIDLQQNIEPIKPLIPVILQSMQGDAYAISAATAITRKLQAEIAPYVDQFMALYLAQLHEEVAEETLIAIGYTVSAAGEAFVKYLPTLMPILLPLLNNVQDTQTFTATLGLLVDLCNCTTVAIKPYCNTIVQALLTALQNPAADRRTRPEIIALLGDIAGAIGGEAYEPYLEFVVVVLQQAGEAIRQLDHFDEDYDNQDFITAFLHAWFSTWTSLFQNYHHNPGALIEYVPFILKVVVATVNGSVGSINAATAISLVGDIIQCLGNKIKPALSQMQELNLCLLAALNSKEKTVVDAAKWVLNLLK